MIESLILKILLKVHYYQHIKWHLPAFQPHFCIIVIPENLDKTRVTKTQCLRIQHFWHILTNISITQQLLKQFSWQKEIRYLPKHNPSLNPNDIHLQKQF